jgi:hypothetical protein
MGNTAKESKPQRQRVNQKHLAKFTRCYDLISAYEFSDKVSLIAYRTLCKTFASTLKISRSEFLDKIYDRILEINSKGEKWFLELVQNDYKETPKQED